MKKPINSTLEKLVKWMLQAISYLNFTENYYTKLENGKNNKTFEIVICLT